MKQAIEPLLLSWENADSSYLTGRMDNNIVVHFKGDKELIGSFVNVRLDEAKGFYYIGEME